MGERTPNVAIAIISRSAGPVERCVTFVTIGHCAVRPGKFGPDCRSGSHSWRPQSIVRLTDGAKVSRQAVTKHLRALAAAGIVRSNRAGRERIWQIQTRRLKEVRRYLDQISARWDEAIVRLQALVEEKEP